MMETLTKEEFWDEMSQNYPKAMKHFNEWIDRYKEENNWKDIFNEDAEVGKDDYMAGTLFEAPKYHDLPIAMQFGIFLEYLSDLGKGKYFPTSVVYIDNFRRTVGYFIERLENRL
jgi:CTP-dependent riboflavin kinase